MRLIFLSAAVPLTKTLSYSKRDDAYTTAPYPMVTRVTSHEVEVHNMLEFAQAVREQGQMGRCLMFGQLDSPLVDESRAGRSIPSDHDWICFDFDKVDAAPTIEGAMYAIGKYLPKVCHHAECVIQLSPSCFNPRATKLSAHVFFKLSEPTSSKVLKDWIVRINFELLEGQIKLTDSANALSFALDRCVTDSSRLLYIAPPKTVGFESDLTPENSLVHLEGHAAVVVPHFTPVTRDEMNLKINQLRKSLELPERSFRTTMVRDQEMMLEPGECVITDVRSSGEGYIRFNINGGNSLAYWINLKEPNIIGNFKGEPYMFTKEAAEPFYKALIKQLQAMPSSSKTIGANIEVLAFYATNRGSKVYVGTYDRATDRLRVEGSTEKAAYSWMGQFGVPIKPSLPHFDLVYDVTSDIRYEEGYPVINLYERTDFIKEFSDLDRTQPLKDAAYRLSVKCPVIYKTLASCTGDARSLEGLINWVAYIFQTRKKTDTAWVLHGTEGTGKGQFMKNVLRPLFGQQNVTQIMMNNVDSNFNSLIDGKIIVNIDEAAMSRTRDKVETMSKLRNWITESTIIINTKKIAEYEAPNNANFIVTANDTRPIHIPEGDRRFHVATRQESRLFYTPNEIAVLEQGEELPEFAKLMGELIVDEAWVRNPEMNEQKARLFESTHSLLDRVGFAIRDGDTQFFLDARPTDSQRAASTSGGLMPIRQYDDMLRAMVDGTFNVLTFDDLFVLFQVTINDSKIFSDNPTQQRAIYNRFNLGPKNRETHRCKRQKKTRYGSVAPSWKDLPPEIIESYPHIFATNPADTNVVPMKKGTNQ